MLPLPKKHGVARICMFPTLKPRPNQKLDDWEQIEVDLPSDAAIHNFLQEHDANVRSLLVFGWARVLQAYSNTDQPVFSIVDTTSESDNNSQSGHPDAHTSCLDLEFDVCTVDALHAIQSSLLSSATYPINGHTLNISTTNGHTLNTPTTNGHTINSPTTNGHTINTPTTNGHTPDIPTTNGHTINPPTANRHVPDVPTTNGQARNRNETQTSAVHSQNRDQKNITTNGTSSKGNGYAEDRSVDNKLFFESSEATCNSAVVFTSRAQEALFKQSSLQPDVDIALIVYLNGPSLHIILTSRRSTTDVKLLQHAAAAFGTLMSDIIQKPFANSSHLRLCSKADTHLLCEWNTEISEQPPIVVHDVIDQTIRQNRDRAAVSAWDGNFTYNEVDRLSTSLAAELVSLGVGPETFVPLLFEKSKWVVVAVMGVMKAGGAFVLLDASYPVERMSRICQELQGNIVVSSALMASTATSLGRSVVTVDNTTTCQKPDHLALKATVHGRNALYAVFTSGSTGIPKGVVHEHGAFYAKAMALIPVIGFDNTSRVLQFASHAFTVSAVDILYTLISGGCLCVPSELERLNDLVSFINRHHVNLALVNPAVTDLLEPNDVPSLRTISIAGESVSLKTLKKWGGHKVRLTQSHGSSETNGHNTASALLMPESDPLNIGYPYGCVIWVVNPHNYQQLAPIGSIGEMVFESQALTRGYLNDEAKTAASFHTDVEWISQFRSVKLPRLFTSGDLARRNPDGTFTFMGRKDQQVKINGQRVDPMEIEYHVQTFLGQLEGVKSGSVRVVVEVVTPCDRDQSLLTAFVHLEYQTAAPSLSSEQMLRQAITKMDHRLGDILPSYMIPGAYVPLLQIPTTFGGKKDRRKLRQMGADMTWEKLVGLKLNRDGRLAPQTSTELRIQQILGELLHIPSETIGMNDNFVHVGGDSVIAMQLVSKAREVGLYLTVSDVLRCPKITDLAEHVSLTPAFDREIIHPFSLLPLRLDVQAVQERASLLCGVDPHIIEDILPCTPIQEALLALTARQSTDHVERRILKLRPGIQIDRLHEALKTVVYSTPTLRTRIVDLPQVGLVQVVINEPLPRRVYEDLQQYLVYDKQREINLGSPLTRFGLIDERHGCKYLVWTLHHAIYDLWSRNLMDRMVEAIYHGQDWSPLAPFNRFVKHAMSIERDTSMAFWERTLLDTQAEEFPPLPSSTYYPHGNAVLELNSNNLRWNNTNITASNIIRAAWSILQAKYTNSNDVVFGATVTGRQIPVLEIERMAGATISTVPIRVTIDYESPVKSFLQKIQDDAIDMIPFESLGLQHIRRISDKMEQICNFNVLLSVQPAEDSVNDVREVFVSKEGASNSSMSKDAGPFATHAITLVCKLVGKDGMSLRVHFDSTVIDPRQMERITNQFLFVIRQLCEVGIQDKKLSDLRILCAEDLDDIWSWNSQSTDFNDQLVHEMIKKTTASQPSALAVQSWDGVLTYQELDIASTQLAHLLVERGIGPRVAVLLFFEKSMWMSVARLGVMKAGGTSIAVDSVQPQERLKMIINQASPRLILSSLSNESMVQPLLPDCVMVLGAATFQGLQHPDNILPVRSNLDPSLPLAVVFTSGSTGNPKGATLTHRGFATAIKHHGPLLGMGPRERVYDFVSYNFDISWFNALQAFAWGACLCVPSEDERQNDLQGSLNQFRSTYAMLTPSVARLLDPKSCPSMKTFVLGGEPQRWSDFEHWPASVKKITVYGPAECTVVSNIADAKILKQRDLSVGPAIASNTWLLDPVKGNELVPIGCVGELWLEGPIVGEGYLKDPERTKASFVQDPVWLVQGAPGHSGRSGRLYRTGDLMRYNQDGTLVFAGRKDHQVKIRGQRVELGEVEFHMQRDILVGKNSHVVAEVITPYGSETPTLMVFVALPDDEAREKLQLGQQDLFKRLHKRIPIYMIPSVCIPLQQIPMTSNGKIDRKELKKIGSSLTVESLATLKSPATEKSVPSSVMEKSLQQLWASILKTDASNIYANDNFFAMGGDSISVMRMVARAREQGITLTTTDVFQQPVLHDLATIAKFENNEDFEILAPFSLLQPGVDQDALLVDASQRCNIPVSSVQDVYPPTALQQGMMAMTAKHEGDYVAHFVFELDYGTDLTRLREAWETVFVEVPILRTRIADLLDLGFMQVVASGFPEWTSGHDDLTTYMSQRSQQEIGLGTSLVHFGVVDDCSLEKRFLIWTIHHAIYDGWTLPIIMEEVKRVYLHQSRRKLSLFQKFVKHIIQQSQVDVAAYWEAQLANTHPAAWPILPNASYQPRNNSTVRYRTTDVNWTSGHVTPASMIRAALALLIAQYVNSDDILLGATISGRQAPIYEIESIIGPTLATVPVRIQLDMKSNAHSYLRQVQTQAVQMIPFEQTGLQKIKGLGPEIGRSTEFQTLLVVHPREDKDSSRNSHDLFWPADCSEQLVNNMESFSQYAMLIICQLEADGCNIQFSFDSNVVSIGQVERFAEQLDSVLHKVVTSDETTRLVDLTSPSRQDLSQIWQWNGEVLGLPEKCIHEMIMIKAQEQPEAPSLCARDGNLSYRQLWNISTRTAYRLMAMGVHPGDVILLCFEKLSLAPIAMLGVLMAGGVPLCLSSNATESYIQKLVISTKPKLALCSQTQQSKLRNVISTHVVDSSWLDGAAAQAHHPMPETCSGDPAMILLTSGSRGKTKSVVINHCALAASANQAWQAFRLNQKSRVFQHSPYDSHTNAIETLACFIAGGCLCIPSEQESLTELSTAISTSQADCAILTPSMIATISPHDVPSLSTLILVGEPVREDLIERWSGKVSTFISYSSGEAPFVTCAYVQADCWHPGTMGRSRAGTLWITNPWDVQILAPVGAIGELVIEGSVIGTEYLNDAESNTNSFIESPRWLRSGDPNHQGRESCVLRTGDLVRYDEDGSLIYVGHKGSQRRIHGLMVDLSSVEYQVNRILTQAYSIYMSESTQVVAELLNSAGGHQELLVVFVHTTNGATYEDERSTWRQISLDIQFRLTKYLPVHMIPHMIIPVHKTPVTGSGRLDRKRLHELITPEQVKSMLDASQSHYGLPDEPMELILRSLWITVLKLDDSVMIGKGDSFFRWGGDSISAIRLVGAARNMGIWFTVADVFYHAELSNLAKVASEREVGVVNEIPPFSLLGDDADVDSARFQAAKLCQVNSSQIQDIFPCTPMQKGLMAMTTRRAGDYIRKRVSVLRADVDIDQLHKSIESIAASEASILRTRIIDLPGHGLVQVLVNEQLPWKTGTNIEAHINANDETMALGRPLAQFVVIECSTPNSPRQLIWTMHHALYDEWSTALLDEALERSYFGQATLGLCQFNLFVHHISSMNDKETSTYWQKYFNKSEATVFPTTQFSATNVDKALECSINDLVWDSGEYASTPPVILQAAWAVLQTWYTGSQDTIFGIAVIGRRAYSTGIERIAGPTIATVPVRVTIDETDSLDSLLRKVQSSDTDGIPYEQTGLQKISQISEEAKHACRFQTLLVIHLPQTEIRKSLLFTESTNVSQRESAFSTYSITINCHLKPNGVDLHFAFDQSVVPAIQMKQIAQQFKLIIRQFAGKQPDLSRNVKNMRTTSDKDLEQVLHWNSPYPRSETTLLHNLLMEVARRQPDELAVDAWDGTLSYRELDDITTRLASVLRSEFSVKSGDVIPLCFPKSMWTSVAIWSVMKAGAATVLLDTTQPVDRLKFIVEQVHASIVLTSSEVSLLANSVASDRRVCIIDQVQPSLVSSNSPSLPDVEPTTLLYVVFTSGSTGIPKGVMITHQNFASAIYHQRSVWGLNTTSRVYDFAAYSFDVTWHNHLYTIVSGGCLCVPTETARKNDLVESMVSMGITYADLTTSVSRLFKPSSVPLLSTLLFGGESLTSEDVSNWAGHVKAINTYGPAECTIVTTAALVDPKTQQPNNIGRGLGALTWIVDLDGLRLAPLFTIGELWLEGPLVGAGYLNDPGKTATMFVTDPPWLPTNNGQGRRFYRTGDLVRYDLDGSLVFVGRKDTQVKIRGQRIELGEIEFQIREAFNKIDNANLPFMLNNIVVEALKPKESDQSHLIAFVLLNSDLPLMEGEQSTRFRELAFEVENRLHRLLPSYMIPSAFVPTDEIPITANGKINRKHLKTKGEGMTMAQLAAWSSPEHYQRPPETKVERQLQQLWSSILRMDKTKIGLDDDFFRLGGDSIEAMRLVAAAREEMLGFTVTDIFRHPRLVQLAARVSVQNPEDQSKSIGAFSLLKFPTHDYDPRQQLASLCGVRKIQVEDAFPCTPLQQGLMSLTTKRATDYISKRLFELPMDIEIEKLKSAWQEAFKMCPILRSRIVDLPGQGLVQAVIDEPLHWSSVEDELDTCLDDKWFQPMEMGNPLFQVNLVTVPNRQSYHLALQMHHAVYDGFSVKILEDLIDTLYRGGQVQVPTGFNRFAQHVVQQQNDELAVKFWQALFHGSEATKFPSSVSPLYQPRTTQLISHRICESSEKLSGNTSPITVSTMIKAAWAILQGQYTNSTDTVFGIVSSGRQTGVHEIERIMGPTLATVPIRVSWDPNEDIGALLEMIQNQAINSIEFEQLGLQSIGRVSEEACRGCQFQALLVVQPRDPQSSEDRLLFARPVEVADDRKVQALDAFTTYPLTLVFEPEIDAVQLHVSFDSTMIEEPQVVRIINQIDHILQQLLVADPSMRLSSIALTSELDLLDIWRWNETAPELVEECVHDLIGESVKRYPESPAVCAWDGELTYRELDEVSSQLAHNIVGHVGFQPGAIVPLCFEKSLWMTVAILGVMKAGGASVAIDVNQPRERLRAIVSQVDAGLILCSTQNTDLAHEIGSAQVLTINRESTVVHKQDFRSKKLPTVDPSDKLYVVFTSGSTGTPKGSVISHSNFASAIKHQVEYEGYESTSRVYDFASYAFDVIWVNVLKTLSVGGCLCVPSDTERQQNLAESMAGFQTTFAIITPTLSRLLHGKKPPSLKTLHLVGEALPAAERDTWVGKVQLLNGYGPSECSAYSIGLRLSPSADINVPIGRGYGCCTWVVDPFTGSQLTPIGGIGELWLEGPIIGCGYLNRPDLTAKSFHFKNPHWFSAMLDNGRERNSKFFRTGDLVRYNLDGTLSFIERKDTQVKIRGQRVELAEIEFQFNRLLGRQSDSAVKTVVDVVTSDTDRKQNLVAFVSVDRKGNTRAEIETQVRQMMSSIESDLAQVLPVYMIPKAVVAVDSIPVAATGKTDRRRLREQALLVLEEEKAGPKNEQIAPYGEMEEIVCSTLSEILNLDKATISVNVSFFRLGGDSISAMQLMSRLRACGVAVSMNDLLRSLNIRELALTCRKADNNTSQTHKANTNREEINKHWLLSPIQQLFFEHYPEGLNHYNQSFLLKVAQPVADSVWDTALKSIVYRHRMLRARFKRDETGTWTQKIAEIGEGAFIFRKHDVADLEEMQSLVQKSQECLNISNGPVFAVDLFTTVKTGETYLFLVAHHLVVDLVSWRIIWHDLECSVASRLSTPLSPITTSFSQWCKLQYDACQETGDANALPFDVQQPQLDYWGILPKLNIYAKTETKTYWLDRDATTLLLMKSNESLRTETMDILVALLIHSFCQTFPDRVAPAVTVEGHGREPLDDKQMTDLTEVVGWFTTFCPIQIPWDHSTSVIDAIKLTKDIRRLIPRRGAAYLASRYFTQFGRDKYKGADCPEILLNYMGAFQQLESDTSLFKNADLDTFTVSNFSPDARRVALIDVSITAIEGRLRVSLEHHSSIRHQGRLNTWIEEFVQNLKEASNHLADLAPSWTTSDFPLTNLTYTGLDSLQNHLRSLNIQAENVSDIYPCTPLQEGILLSKQKGVASYNNVMLWRCSSANSGAKLSPELLEDAWLCVVKRHSILSTIFVNCSEEGNFLQVVLRNPAVKVELASPDQSLSFETRLQQRSHFEEGRPEHIFTVFESSGSDLICRLDISHALMDAASVPVLIRDMARACKSKSLGAAPLFKQFVQTLGNEDQKVRLTYWTSFLQNAQPCKIQTIASPELYNNGKTETEGYMQVPELETQKIDLVCKEMSITRSTFLQVAWALVLSWFTQMRDVSFGYLASGRDAPMADIDQLVGPLINLLIARIDLDRSVRDVLESTSQQSVMHLNYQHTSLAEIYHAMGLKNSELFNTAITVRHVYGNQEGNDDEIHFDEMESSDPQEYPLGLNVGLDGTKTLVTFTYCQPAISAELAQEVYHTLRTAILYLSEALELTIADSNVRKSQISAYDGFFEHVVGMSEIKTTQFWQQYFQDSNSAIFPTLPSLSYVPKADSRFERCINGMDWDEDMAEASIAIQLTWAILISRLENVSDVVFGTTTNQSGEGHAQDAYCSHREVLPTRVAFGLDETIETNLTRLHDQASFVASFRNMGIRRIQQINQETQHACRLQTLMAVSVRNDRTVPNNKASLRQVSGYALKLGFEVSELALSLSVDFDATILTARRIEQLASQFECVLRQILSKANRGSALKDIRVASEQDLSQIWSQNAVVPKEIDQCVHTLISQTAKTQPEAIAVSAWDIEFTYRQVEELSTQLALKLLDNNVGTNQVVPLFFEKSGWTPVAMLAVMKAGGTILLIDVTQPEDRLRSIVDQVHFTAVLSTLNNEDLAKRVGNCPVIVVTDGLRTLTELPLHRTLPEVNPSTNLYVVFTSGSTGLPKGVMITHRNLSSAIFHQLAECGIHKSSRIFDFTSHAFDVVYSNTLYTLVAGGCICTPETIEAKSDVAKSMRIFKVSHADLTPAVIRSLDLQDLHPELGYLVTSGESITQAAFDKLPNSVQLLNLYGPAECSITATIAEVDPSRLLTNNIGHGVGVTTWVVDPENSWQLAPISGIGELWLEGPLVGAGYINDAAKTESAFVNDPPWLLQGGPNATGRRGCLYRTGDLVRYNEDGTLNFVGRQDTQVKIRGQRVELGEVEHNIRGLMLARNSSAEVVVEVATPKDATNPVLLAFISLESFRSCREEEVKYLAAKQTTGLFEQLTERLPAYMVPIAIIPVKAMPVSGTGKTDRRKLRDIASSITLQDMTRQSSAKESLPITTPMEEWLQQLWARTLSIEPDIITAGDNFFNIGGDSIGVMRLVGAARKQGISISVADVFSQPRLRDLAKIMRKHLPAQNIEAVPFVSLAFDDCELFIRDEVRPQLRSINESIQISNIYPLAPYQTMAVKSTLDTPPGQLVHFLVDLSPTIEMSRLESCCKKIVSQIELLRTVFVEARGQLWQVVLDELDVPFHRYDWKENDEATFQHICEQDLAAPQQLGQTFLRFIVFSSPARTRLAFRLSHAQYDGFSLTQIFDAFAAALNGQDYAQQPSFARFVEFTSTLQSTAQTHWRNLLNGSSQTNISRNPQLTGDASQGAITAAKQVTTPRKPPGVTMATMFTAACADMIASITNSADVVFGRLVSGRAGHPIELQDTVGCCINIVPVRVQFEPQRNMTSAITFVQEQYSQSIPFEAVDVSEIVKDLTGDSFRVVTQFQNIDEVVVAEVGDVKAELRPNLSKFMRAPLEGGIWISGEPRRDGLHLSAVACPRSFDVEMVENILTQLAVSLDRVAE